MIIYESVEAWCERRECKMALRGKSEEKFKLKRVAIGIFETCLARCFCRLMYGIFSIKRPQMEEKLRRLFEDYKKEFRITR